jgi:hypothetical protein
MPHFDIYVFAWGVLGGSLGELFKWYQLRESPNLPEYARKPLYWIITAIMVIFGGVLAVIQLQDVDASKQWIALALNIGASAPLIVKTMASSVPAAGPVPEAGQRGGLDVPVKGPSVLDFIAGR